MTGVSTARALPLFLMLLLFTAVASAFAQRSSTTRRAGENFVFRVEATLDSLVADNESETTLVAFLSTADGGAIEGERIRFILRDGTGLLGDGDDVATNGVEVGNGIYVAKLRAGTVEGPVTISAVWVSAPFSPLPREEVSVNLVTAETLRVELDDPLLLANGQDQATIAAYLLDGLGRPVNNAKVRFELLQGTGELTPQVIAGRNGRYAATFRAGTEAGQAVIEVSLPTNTRTLREQVTIDIVETATMAAFAFPEQVAHRLGNENEEVQLENTSTILVPVRDGDGDLVRGLTNAELVAQVIGGPGRVVGPVEILLGGQNRSGVYQFTFVAGETTGVAGETTGSSTVRILNLESPTQASADVTIETVPEEALALGDETARVRFAMTAHSDLPFYADGASQALIVSTAADQRGKAVTGLGPEMVWSIADGQGILTAMRELPSPAGAFGSGIYLATFVAGTSGIDTQSQIRVTFVNDDGIIEDQELTIELSPLGAPRFVFFPERLPARPGAVVTIDIFDFDTGGLEELGLTGLAAANAAAPYRVDVVGGPGRVVEPVTNDGSGLDLVAEDNVSTVVMEVEGAAGAEQGITLDVIDLAAAGYPQQEAFVQLGQTVTLRAITQPTVLDKGEVIEIIAFAQDEFGLPAIDHDLRLTVLSGSARALNGGRMIDNGLETAGFADPFPADGMYVGALRVTGTTGGSVTVRITDLSASNLPEVELRLQRR